MVLPTYLFVLFVIVAFEKSDRYFDSAIAAVVAELVVCRYAFLLLGRRRFRLVKRWAADHEVDRAKALEGAIHPFIYRSVLESVRPAR
ncbi:MAG: hypothetical protein ACLP3C_08310 [Mycobacterium sp.]|uniref:hypothetical protein n=1 Tax=Mycobacterium sp. TaxID=1785 RepID=UPI003F9A1350